MAISEAATRVLDFIRRRKGDYQTTFLHAHGQRVLMDMAHFARANETCVVLDADNKVDRDRTLVLEGRREMFLRIQQHLNLTSEELAMLYSGQQFTRVERN